MESKERPSYLDYSVTKQKDAIETYFCEPLDKNGKKEAMTDDLSKVFITLCMVKDGEVEEMYEEFKKVSHIFKILESRAEFAGLKADKKTMIMISCICSSPGGAVMYVYYLLYKIKKLGLNELSFEKMSTDIFPFGFFSDDTLSYYWDTQKVNRGVEGMGSDNLLDYSEAAKSLTEIEIK